MQHAPSTERADPRAAGRGGGSPCAHRRSTPPSAAPGGACDRTRARRTGPRAWHGTRSSSPRAGPACSWPPRERRAPLA